MSLILTVDDSRALRTIINRSLSADYEVIEAEDGEKGLEALEANPVDLVLLDVTMPVLDGPGMLKEMRARDNQTPVVLLTAESKTSLIGEMMALGLSDYILKPFQPAELRQKVISVLGFTASKAAAAANTQAPAYASAPASSGGPKPAAGRPSVDVLIIDDMDNVAKKFRDALPKHLKVANCLDGQSAMAACREKIFRTIVVDTVIPDVNSVALSSQLRVLQPTSAFIGLYMRNVENPQKLARDQGFDSFLVKPFQAEQINSFMATYYDANDVLSIDDNVLAPSVFPESKERRGRFTARLTSLTMEAIDKVAAACHEDLIFNLENPPPADQLPRLLLSTMKRCSEMGLGLRVVAGEETTKAMATIAETAQIPTYDSIEAAKAA